MLQSDMIRVGFKGYEQILHSPISILPDDVLRYLFIFMSDSNIGSHQLTIHITHVCRSWRQIALDSALLWNKIKCTAGPSMLRIQTFLERSKDAPLEIDIRREKLDRISVLLVDILLPRISRLKALSFTSTFCGMQYFLQHITADPSNQENTYRHAIQATNLESLRLDALTCGLQTDGTGVWFGGHVPKLQTLRLCGIRMPIHQPFLPNITSLSLAGHASENIASIIARCPQIRELFLTVIPPISLAIPTLQKLSLSLPTFFDHNLTPTCLTSQSWDGLVELKLHNVDIKAMLEVLRQTQRLERATLHASPPRSSRNSVPFVTATLKSLVSLDINFGQQQHHEGTNVLRYFQTPVLKNLRLELGKTLNIPIFIDYLARTHPPLQYLSLQRFKPTVKQLCLIFTNIPYLEELSINEPPKVGAKILEPPKVGAKILKAFKRHLELCTRLRSISIESCDQDTRQRLDTFLHRRRESMGKDNTSSNVKTSL